MNRFNKTLTITSITLATAFSMSTASAADQADLVPFANALGSGKVSVKNIGQAESRVSWLTIQCLAKSCPEHPGMNSYKNAKFPNTVAIKIPALKPDASYDHQLAFWNQLQFKPGQYKFLVLADAGHDIPESNEANNKAYYVRTVNKAIDDLNAKIKLNVRQTTSKLKVDNRNDKKAKLRALKSSGKQVSFKQMPINAQRAVESAFNIQVKGKTQASSCAQSTPRKIGNFTQEVQLNGWPQCVIGDGIFGCTLNYRWTGCVEQENGQWECDWDSEYTPTTC